MLSMTAQPGIQAASLGDRLVTSSRPLTKLNSVNLRALTDGTQRKDSSYIFKVIDCRERSSACPLLCSVILILVVKPGVEHC